MHRGNGDIEKLLLMLLFPLLVFNMCFNASLVQKKVLFKFISITSLHSLIVKSVIFSDAPFIPALLTNTSTPPNLLIAPTINDLRFSSLDTSPDMKIMLLSSAIVSRIISLAASFNALSSLAFKTTE